MNAPEYPTPWQKKSIWAALTTLSVVAIGAVAVGLIWLFSTVMAFLQPILVPFAVAGVLAYLFEPVVSKIVSEMLGTSRKRARAGGLCRRNVIALTGILIWIIPAVWTQTGKLVQRVPAYRDRVLHVVEEFNEWAHSIEVNGVHLLPQIPKKDRERPLAPAEEPTPAATTPENSAPAPAIEPETAIPSPAPGATNPAATAASVAACPDGAANPDNRPHPRPPTATKDSAPGSIIDLQSILQGDWVRTAVPGLLHSLWRFITQSIGGFLGVFGYLLWPIIVPIYLYYFLIESKNIAESWGDYLPLRASVFKDEVVATLEEINGYLIAFFRGQLLVSMINGTITGLLLVSFGLDFGILIGLMLCFLGIIPYIGITLCWVPAVLMAVAQGGSGTWIPADPWWLFPLIVTAIFILVQQVDGLFVTPKIVGESVGLHPMTVIVSVCVWGLLLGGLLGAILAVPLTATVKVLLRRYIWERRLRAEESAPLTEESFEVQKAQETMKLEAPALK